MAARVKVAAAFPQIWQNWRNRDRRSSPQDSDDTTFSYSHMDTDTNTDGAGPSLRVDTTSRPHASMNTLRANADRFRSISNNQLHRVPEEVGDAEDDDNATDRNDEDDDDWEAELEEQGLYAGSYSRLVRLYAIVPLSSLVTFILVALLPWLIWPLPHGSHIPSSPSFPVPELLVSIAFWSLSHTIRVPIYSFYSLLPEYRFLPTFLPVFMSTFTSTLISVLLRIFSFAILHIRHDMDSPVLTTLDPAFFRVIWVGLGWALADVVVGIKQGYEGLRLYESVMVDVPRGREREFMRSGLLTGKDNMGGDFEILDASSRREVHVNHERSVSRVRDEEIGVAVDRADIDLQVEGDLDQLLGLKAREELEEVYGIAVVKIPVFISVLQRLNSILLSQGLTLLLSWAFFSSSISISSRSNSYPDSSNWPLLFVLPIFIVQLVLTFLHTPPLLAIFGLHSTSYIGLIVGIASLCAGLGVWGALS